VSLGLFYDPILPEFEEIFSDLEVVLLGIKEEVEMHGSRLLVLLFPVRIQVDEGDWNLLRKFFALDERRFRLTYPNRRILEYCRAHGVDFLDLLSPLRRHMEEHDRPLFRSRGGMHLNEDGQAICAEAIHEKVMNLIEG
jgi:hypothetical protein